MEWKAVSKTATCGTDGNAAQQIPDDRRQPEPVRQVSECQRGSETAREGQDQIKVRHVWLSF